MNDKVQMRSQVGIEAPRSVALQLEKAKDQRTTVDARCVGGSFLLRRLVEPRGRWLETPRPRRLRARHSAIKQYLIFKLRSVRYHD